MLARLVVIPFLSLPLYDPILLVLATRAVYLQYVVRAVSLSGEAECEAAVSLAQTPPGFAHKLERQKDVDEGEPLELKAKLDGSPIPTAKW